MKSSPTRPPGGLVDTSARVVTEVLPKTIGQTVVVDIHTNTLAENLADIQDKDRRDVIPANPRFGGKECKEVQQNVPILVRSQS